MSFSGASQTIYSIISVFRWLKFRPKSSKEAGET
jgi:hypothetical protein